MNLSSPTSPPVNDGRKWDEAFLRTESYLRAYHLESRELLNQLTAEIILEAKRQGKELPAADPVSLAMHITHERIGAWFARAGNGGDWSDVHVRIRARFALALTGLSGKWADQVFSANPVLPELAALLASATLQPGPSLMLSNMPTAPLEFGFEDGAMISSRKGVWLLVRTAGWSIGLVGVFGLVWVQTR